MYKPHFGCPFVCRFICQHLDYFYLLAVAKNMGVQVSVCAPAFTFLGYISGDGIAGACVNTLFNL